MLGSFDYAVILRSAPFIWGGMVLTLQLTALAVSGGLRAWRHDADSPGVESAQALTASLALPDALLPHRTTPTAATAAPLT